MADRTFGQEAAAPVAANLTDFAAFSIDVAEHVTAGASLGDAVAKAIKALGLITYPGFLAYNAGGTPEGVQIVDYVAPTQTEIIAGTANKEPADPQAQRTFRTPVTVTVTGGQATIDILVRLPAKISTNASFNIAVDEVESAYNDQWLGMIVEVENTSGSTITVTPVDGAGLATLDYEDGTTALSVAAGVKADLYLRMRFDRSFRISQINGAP